jgi:hypothetical protein
MTSENAICLEGVFWQIETPERRVRGQLELSDGAAPVLETVGWPPLFDERAYRITFSEHGMTIAHSGNPDDLVADFQPRDINGELDDGRQVSLVEAQGNADPSSFMGRHYRQKFRARHAVMDELVDAAQRYAGFKFYLRGSGWWRCPDDQAQTDDGSNLRLTWEDDTRLFEFSPAAPLTFREADPTVLSPITTLASLVTDNPEDFGGLHVQLAADGPWRKVYGPEEPIGPTSHPLLNTTHLTAVRFAKWIDFRKRTRGLDAAAITALDGIVI